MIVNAKHPLLFCALIFSDLMENLTCIATLARQNKRRFTRIFSRAISSKIAPIENQGSVGKDDGLITQSPKSVGNDNQKVPLPPGLSLISSEETFNGKKKLRRTSSLVSAISHLAKEGMEPVDSIDSSKVYIMSILLEREFVELIVPIQAMIAVSLMYFGGAKHTNTVVSDWDDDHYKFAMIYLVIDIGMELLIFSGTYWIVEKMFPRFSARNILLRILGSKHFWAIFIFCCVSWLTCNVMQTTYSGMDTGFEFKWIQSECNDNGEALTWVQGFQWDYMNLTTGGECV